MIRFENVEVYNIGRAIYSARNPLNSWDKSDTDIDNDIIGEKDLKLAQRLIKAGADHRKFMRQIFVTVDITAPLYWWKQMDQYRVSVVSNSTSTMHTIHKKEFTMDDFSCEHLEEASMSCLNNLIVCLNEAREIFCQDKSNKNAWWQMIQLLPQSYNQRRTITLNYENLRNIYFSRRNHKLTEWSVGCMDFINTLPYANELIKIQHEA